MANRMYECISKQSSSALRGAEISVFAKVKDFIEEFSGFSNLALDNFRFLIFYYFLFGFLVFVVAFGYRGLVMVTKTITRMDPGLHSGRNCFRVRPSAKKRGQ